MKKDIYIIKNTVNNLCYIGQSTDYLTRFRKHKEEAVRNQYKYKSVLYDAMNEFGIDKPYFFNRKDCISNTPCRNVF